MYGLYCVSPRYCPSTDALIGSSRKLIAASSFPAELFFLKWEEEAKDPEYWEEVGEDGVALGVYEIESWIPVFPSHLKPVEERVAELISEDIPF